MPRSWFPIPFLNKKKLSSLEKWLGHGIYNINTKHLLVPESKEVLKEKHTRVCPWQPKELPIAKTGTMSSNKINSIIILAYNSKYKINTHKILLTPIND